MLLDLFARRVVGWAASATNDTELALAALGNALRDRNPGPGLVQSLGSRKSPYASGDYRCALARCGIVASMSRKGVCWDKCGRRELLRDHKAELTEDLTYATHDAAIASIADYIERFYNPQRRHSHLDYIIRMRSANRVADTVARAAYTGERWHGRRERHGHGGSSAGSVAA